MILKIILGAFVAYGLYAGLLFSSQRKMLFPGQQITPPQVNSLPSFIEKVPLQLSSGAGEAWFIPAQTDAPSNPAPAVIFGHGNGEIIDYCVNDLMEYPKRGIHLLLVEYPGYGRCEGNPTQASITEAMCAGYDWLKTRTDVDSSKIFAHGRSVGGGAVCALARKRQLKALILVSTFTSVRQFAGRYFVPPYIVRDPFNNKSVVKNFNGPILIFHGRFDTVIPYTNGEALSKAAKQGTFISYDCAHNNCPPDFEQHWKSIDVFLARAGIR